jgi:hypothetical protein
MLIINTLYKFQLEKNQVFLSKSKKSPHLSLNQNVEVCVNSKISNVDIRVKLQSSRY